MNYKNKILVSESGLTQKHLIHGDEELFQHELRTIFARNWLFLTHDSLIPSPGDYVTAKWVLTRSSSLGRATVRFVPS